MNNWEANKQKQIDRIEANFAEAALRCDDGFKLFGLMMSASSQIASIRSLPQFYNAADTTSGKPVGVVKVRGDIVAEIIKGADR